MLFNDEPTIDDHLGHIRLIKPLAKHVLDCHPPQVFGICGRWGAGKTSFLKKLWAYLGGPVEFRRSGQTVFEKLDKEEWKKHFDADDELHKLIFLGRNRELIWFNPWHHQFENSPLVALLNEIRHHFAITMSLYEQTGKIRNLAKNAVWNTVAESAKLIKLSLPDAKTAKDLNREYDSENFSGVLGSQRFRQLFEEAIDEVTDKQGKLVIFIDDLDRCESETSYRLLEALKLYLNVKNCIFVVGIDREHLEINIAKVLHGEKDGWNYRPIARDYLNKMFQHLFVLPTPGLTGDFLQSLWGANFRNDRLWQTASRLFEWTGAGETLALDALMKTLDSNLPHNPRKIKSFLASWATSLEMVEKPDSTGPSLDWRLSVVLHYLAQFEEPLFRKVEESPGFLSNEIFRFCRGSGANSPYFKGLELPYEMPAGSGVPEENKEGPPPRTFWIARLISEIAEELGESIPGDWILKHVPRTGSKG